MFKGINKNLIKYSSDYPCLFVLTGLLISIIPFICFADNLLYAVSATLILSALILLITPQEIFFKILFWAIIGLLIVSINNLNIFSNNEKALQLIEGKRYVKATVTDFNAIGNKFIWLSNPKNITINITAYRIDKTDSWTNCKIKTLASIKNCKNLEYGSKVELSGYISTPLEPVVTGAFNYKNYLKSCDINFQFYGNVTKVLNSKSNSLYMFAYKLRNILLNNLCGDIQNSNVRNFIAGIIFGCKQNISPELKDKFIQNGIIHIMAISGLHVGILALILLIIFSFLPVRIRYFFVPFLLFLYILLIGFQPSAVRAFVMITVFCLFRSFFLSDKSLNNIFFAAVILIIFSPEIIISAGFQFSFLITGILIVSWKKSLDWQNAAFEKLKWIPAKSLKNKAKIMNKFNIWFFTSSLVCITAAAASCGLTVYYQKLFIPFMPVINLLIVPFMFPLILIAGIKIILVTVFGPALNSILNLLINLIVQIIFTVTGWSSSAGVTYNLSYIQFIVILIFYILILGFIFHKQKSVKFICLCISIFIIFAAANNMIFNLNHKKYILQPPGDYGSSIIELNFVNSTANIKNLPGYSAYTILNFLTKHNIHKVNKIYIGNSGRIQCSNAEIIIEQLKVKKLVLYEDIRNSKSLKNLEKLCKIKNIDLVVAKPISMKQNILNNSNQWQIK